jgi:hypothetical protein
MEVLIMFGMELPQGISSSLLAFGVVTNFVSTALGASGVTFVRHIREKRRRRESRLIHKLWNGIEGNVLIVSCKHGSPDSYDGPRAHAPFVGYEDLKAAQYLFKLIQETFPNTIRVENYFDDITSRLHDHHIIFVGAGVTSPHAVTALEKINPRFDFENTKDGPEVWNVKDTGSRSIKTYTPSYNDKGEVVEDYGIVVRGPNPFSSNKKVIVIAGVHGTATLGAAMVACEEGYLNKQKEIETALDAETCSLLVKVNVQNNGVIHGIDVIKSHGGTC